MTDDELEALQTEYDLPTSIDGIALFYGADVYEYKDYSLAPGERLGEPRSPSDAQALRKGKLWARRTYFSVDGDDLDQEIELKLFVQESKQGFRFTGAQLMTVIKNAATDYYRKDARWYEKVDIYASRLPPLHYSYEELQLVHWYSDKNRV